MQMSRLNKITGKKCAQDTSRKSKSIRVSPLNSALNTGCVNSPKNSLSPNRNRVLKQSFISQYINKALANPNITSKKRNIKTHYSHKRVYSDGNSGPKAKPEKDLNTKKNSRKSFEFDEKTLKKEPETLHVEIEKTFCRDGSKRRFYKTSDPDELVREKLIDSISLSFKTSVCGPVTTIDFYKIVKQIGNGAFGKVYLAIHRLTGLKVAIKKVEKSYIKDESTRRKVLQEVYIMKKLNSRHIIRLLEVFESNHNIMIVLEYAGGGDLLQIMRIRGSLSESEAKAIFIQVVDGLKACHSIGIVHRDIKLDNILLSTDLTEIKICDFGVSRFSKPGERVNEQCGTPAYLAPEIIANQGYEPFFVDTWSLGVLLYAMLSASVPFKAKSLPDLHKLILKGCYETPSYFSEEVKDLIGKMLNLIPQNRISLDEMKKHPWLAGLEPQCFREPGTNTIKQNEILKIMSEFGFPRDYIVQSLNLKDLNHASATYNLLDINKNIY
jgi:serine/threonine protein kinase